MHLPDEDNRSQPTGGNESEGGRCARAGYAGSLIDTSQKSSGA